MSVGGLGATFKCRVLRALAQMDARFPALVRVVKAWARARGVNDATNGTFNSHAIVLLVRAVVSDSVTGQHRVALSGRA